MFQQNWGIQSNIVFNHISTVGRFSLYTQASITPIGVHYNYLTKYLHFVTIQRLSHATQGHAMKLLRSVISYRGTTILFHKKLTMSHLASS